MREITEEEKADIYNTVFANIYTLPRGKTYSMIDMLFDELTRRGFKIVKEETPK